jgi:hypothetical protein
VVVMQDLITQALNKNTTAKQEVVLASQVKLSLWLRIMKLQDLLWQIIMLN